MKLISWNVNGIRAIRKKNFDEYIANEQPHVFCLQETKVGRGQLEEAALRVDGYERQIVGAVKKGYSGVATYVREGVKYSAAKTVHGIGEQRFDDEGRVVVTHHPGFILHNIYFPSGTSGEVRQAYKYEFLDTVLAYLKGLPAAQRARSVICGDFNICHTEIDIHHPEVARKRELSGYLEDECAWMDSLVEAGFSDSYRLKHPKTTGKYSWWTYRAGARGKNLGWRIDYFFVGKGLVSKVKRADIHTEVLGSDHCPVVLELDL